MGRRDAGAEMGLLISLPLLFGALVQRMRARISAIATHPIASPSYPPPYLTVAAAPDKPQPSIHHQPPACAVPLSTLVNERRGAYAVVIARSLSTSTTGLSMSVFVNSPRS